ncbi:MAG: hypothetical protein LVQ97_04865 [Candidatus Micrarchaeales archaeon]|nr:hypothetical protein [Candidatus Micrarchaeales archaeon]
MRLRCFSTPASSKPKRKRNAKPSEKAQQELESAALSANIREIIKDKFSCASASDIDKIEELINSAAAASIETMRLRSASSTSKEDEAAMIKDLSYGIIPNSVLYKNKPKNAKGMLRSDAQSATAFSSESASRDFAVLYAAFKDVICAKSKDIKAEDYGRAVTVARYIILKNII